MVVTELRTDHNLLLQIFNLDRSITDFVTQNVEVALLLNAYEYELQYCPRKIIGNA